MSADIAIAVLIVDGVAVLQDATVGRLCSGAPDTALVVAVAVRDGGGDLLCPVSPLASNANHPIRSLWPNGPCTGDPSALLRQEIWYARALLGNADAGVTVYQHADLTLFPEVRAVFDETPRLTVQSSPTVSDAATDPYLFIDDDDTDAEASLPPQPKADTRADGPGAAPDADPSPRRGHRMLFALTVLGALALACWLMPLPFDVDDVVVTVETLAGQAADWFSDLVGRIGELVS